MTRKVPQKKETVEIPGLGSLQGWRYENGLRQFFGVPFARIQKRWTRATLATEWKDQFHDGTKLGPRYPTPPDVSLIDDPLLPVKEIDLHEFSEWPSHDLECLNMNIVTPPADCDIPGPYPVMVWIHGGAYYFGGNYHPIFDMANFVSHGLQHGLPVVSVTINYRLGLGGFLASKQIQQDLEKDRYEGVGNFALTDQQTALEWVQRYIKCFNGNPDSVTIFGESAGGISVAQQISAANPACFHRAILMSGSLNLASNWSLERHQERFDNVLRCLDVSLDDPDALDKLRALPEATLTDATSYAEPSDFIVYHPCWDGVFHASKPSLEFGSSLPSWLGSIMIGDTLDEGELWRDVIAKHDLNFFRQRMLRYMSPDEVDRILDLYGVTAQSSHDQVVQAIIEMCGDANFKIANFVLAHNSPLSRTFAYHIDQKSTLDSTVGGQAHHAIDLFYVFLNGRESMTAQQVVLGEKMALDWLSFANERDPWERFSTHHKWMVYGSEKARDSWELQTESEDDSTRHYTRTKTLLREDLYKKLWLAIQDIGYERYRLPTIE
ncbi:hypothetical protein ACHAPJ_009768 [Fusarium lateritium]